MKFNFFILFGLVLTFLCCSCDSEKTSKSEILSDAEQTDLDNGLEEPEKKGVKLTVIYGYEEGQKYEKWVKDPVFTCDSPDQDSHMRNYIIVIASKPGFYSEMYSCSKEEEIKISLLDRIETDKNTTGRIFSDLEMSYINVNQYEGRIDNVTLRGKDATDSILVSADEKGTYSADIDFEIQSVYFQSEEFGIYTFEDEEGNEYQYGSRIDTSGSVMIRNQDSTDAFLFLATMSEDKPNIYIYPEETTELDVEIKFPAGGRVTKSIPEYGKGWHVTVGPNGKVDGEYGYLFYEAATPDFFQKKSGWIVKEDDAESFFRDNLYKTGARGQEIEDFIDWWMPFLNGHEYYAVYPQYNKEIDQVIQIEFSKKPDNFARVFYIIEPVENPDLLNLESPVIPSHNRSGYHAFEWGVIIRNGSK